MHAGAGDNAATSSSINLAGDIWVRECLRHIALHLNTYKYFHMLTLSVGHIFRMLIEFMIINSVTCIVERLSVPMSTMPTTTSTSKPGPPPPVVHSASYWPHSHAHLHCTPQMRHTHMWPDIIAERREYCAPMAHLMFAVACKRLYAECSWWPAGGAPQWITISGRVWECECYKCCQVNVMWVCVCVCLRHYALIWHTSLPRQPNGPFHKQTRSFGRTRWQFANTTPQHNSWPTFINRTHSFACNLGNQFVYI